MQQSLCLAIKSRIGGKEASANLLMVNIIILCYDLSYPKGFLLSLYFFTFQQSTFIMSVINLALILLSSIGFLFSGVFSAYILFIKKSKNHLHLLFGGLLLALSLRIGKSVFYNFTDLPVIIKNIGLAANLAIGPFLLLYGKVLIQQHELQRRQLWHFLPAAVYFIFSALIPNQTGDDTWYASYTFVIFQQFCYLGLSFLLIKNRKDIQQKGFVILWVAISVIWLTYLLIFIQILPVYIFGALAYSILVMLLAYFSFTEQFMFSIKEKYEASRLSSKQSQRYLDIIQKKIILDQSYLNPNLSIQNISNQINLPTKVISQVTNEQLKLNFSAFINTYRIEEAKKRLISEEYQQFTIASIAYDCGFNSISSFNTTFKANTKQTPSQYRKAFLKTSV